MKALIFAIAVMGLKANAAEMTCADMVQSKKALALELNWLQEKMRDARSSDELELYIEQWELISAELDQVIKTIDEVCQGQD